MVGRPLNDVSGQRFGRLIAVEHLYKQNIWRCVCDCGKEKLARGHQLRIGFIKSCGCLNREMSAARQWIHGGYGTPEHLSWRNAKRRCSDPRDKRYGAYGGRGIKFCERWRDSFANFLADMGPRPPGMTLERIDVNGHYEPLNCKWATWEEQRKNKRPRGLVRLHLDNL
jgi:hypothetical protein